MTWPRPDAAAGEEAGEDVAPVVPAGRERPRPRRSCRPALIGEIRGVRPISPHITTSVSSSRPRCSQVVEEAAQAVVDRRQQLPLEVAEGVLVRVPAAQVDLHHAHARLDQPPGDEEALAPLLAAVEVARRARAPASGRTDCRRPGRRGQQELQRPAGGARPRRRARRPGGRRRGRGEARRAGRAARPGRSSCGSDRPSAAEVGQVERRVAAAAELSHQAFGPLPGGAGGVVGVVVAEAVRARAGRVGRAARRGEIDAPAVVARPEQPGPAAGVAHEVRRAATRPPRGRPLAGAGGSGVGEQRADRRPLEPARARGGDRWRWCRRAASRSSRCAAGTCSCCARCGTARPAGGASCGRRENRSARAASRGRYSQKRTPGSRVCGRAVLAADAVGGVGLGVERLVLRRPARLEDEDDRTGRFPATATRTWRS